MEERNGQRFFSVAEFARLLGVSKQTAYGLVEKGAVRAIRPDGLRCLRISAEAIEEYVKKSEVVRHA